MTNMAMIMALSMLLMIILALLSVVVFKMMSLTMLMPVLMMSKWECRKEEGWSRQSWREGTRAHPASTQFTLGRRACVAFVTNIFMDVPSNYLCGVMIESIMEVPHLDTWTKMFIHP